MEETPGNNGSPAIPLRIWSPLLKELLPYLEKNTEKYLIGAEEKGENQTPHHHIWAVTTKSPDSFRKHLKKICTDKGLPVSQKGKANAYYSISTPDERYDESYSVKNGCHLSKGYTLEQIDQFVQRGKKRFPDKVEGKVILDLPILAQQVNAQAVNNLRPVKRMPMAQQFMFYMINEKGWKKGQEISIDLHDYINKRDELSDHLTECFENKFTVPEGQRIFRHAVWSFADDTVKEKIKVSNRESFFKACGL